jgi:hypothetical protein
MSGRTRPPGTAIVGSMKSTLALTVVLALGSIEAKANSGASLPATAEGPGGAMELTLAPDLSFTDDSSSNFPIRGKNLADGRIASDRPTAIFFGTAHCWNTNREAERFVALFPLYRDRVRFLVVDLDHPSREQRALVSRFYGGFIPHLTFLDRNGRVVYSRSGETAAGRGDVRGLEELTKKALD